MEEELPTCKGLLWNCEYLRFWSSKSLRVSGVRGFGVFRFRLLESGIRGSTQRSQYPLIKEYTLNHDIKASII